MSVFVIVIGVCCGESFFDNGDRLIVFIDCYYVKVFSGGN